MDEACERSRDGDSNPGPTVYETVALPTELSRLIGSIEIYSKTHIQRGLNFSSPAGSADRHYMNPCSLRKSCVIFALS